MANELAALSDELATRSGAAALSARKSRAGAGKVFVRVAAGAEAA